MHNKTPVGGKHMSMTECRNAKRGKESAAGSVELELREVQKLQGNNKVDGIETISATCGEVFTIICC